MASYHDHDHHHGHDHDHDHDHHDEPSSPPQDLSASGLTIPSDSEPYSSISPPSSSPPDSSNNNGAQPVIIYQPPTFWGLLRGAAINLLLPFVNGLMLGFGELFAHEFAFRLGWSQTNVSAQPGRSLRLPTNADRSSHYIEQAGRPGQESRSETTLPNADDGMNP